MLHSIIKFFTATTRTTRKFRKMMQKAIYKTVGGYEYHYYVSGKYNVIERAPANAIGETGCKFRTYDQWPI